MQSPEPVICALEETSVSRHAARAAGWLAGMLKAPLVLVQVFDPMGVPAYPRREMIEARSTTGTSSATIARRLPEAATLAQPPALRADARGRLASDGDRIAF